MGDDNDRDARHWFAAYTHEVEQHRRDEKHYRWHVDALQKRCAELLERARRAEARAKVYRILAKSAGADPEEMSRKHGYDLSGPFRTWEEIKAEAREPSADDAPSWDELEDAHEDEGDAVDGDVPVVRDAEHARELYGEGWITDRVRALEVDRARRADAVRLLEERLSGKATHDSAEKQAKRIAELEAQVERLRAVCKKHRDAMGQLMAEHAQKVASIRSVRPIREQVEEFHRAMGQPVLDTPQVPDDQRVRLRLKLIAEEFCELLEAAGVPDSTPYEDHNHFALEWLLQDLIGGALGTFDLVAFTDALADLDYVIEGTRLEFGIDGAPIAAEVHRSNMAKTGGEVREDGKVLKPADWTPPDIAGELRKQGWQS